MVTNIPDTIERKRVWDETIAGAVPESNTADAAEGKEGDDPSNAPGDGDDEAAALAKHEKAQVSFSNTYKEMQYLLLVRSTGGCICNKREYQILTRFTGRGSRSSRN